MELSILLVTFNQENFISQSIDSIILQKIPFNFEIIVADDCSTDSTLSIIQNKFDLAGYKYKILDNKNNLGLAKNYQRGFAACRGDYIAIMEGDDYWTDPERLIKHVNFLNQHRECVMSFNSIIELEEESCRFNVPVWSLKTNFEYITSYQLAEGNKIGNLSSCVFRTEIINKLDQRIYELKIADWMLGMAAGQYGLIAKLKDAMSVYRIHSNGQWSKKSPKLQKRSMIEAIEGYNEYLNFNYNDEFNNLKASLTNKNLIIKAILKNIIEYLPPIIILLIKLFVPKKILKLIKTIK